MGIYLASNDNHHYPSGNGFRASGIYEHYNWCSIQPCMIIQCKQCPWKQVDRCMCRSNAFDTCAIGGLMVLIKSWIIPGTLDELPCKDFWVRSQPVIRLRWCAIWYSAQLVSGRPSLCSVPLALVLFTSCLFATKLNHFICDTGFERQ